MMKPHSLYVAGALALALVCYAQQPGQSKLLRAKDGTFAIYYADVDTASVIVDFLVDGDLRFSASGTRLSGFSKDQGLTFAMNALNGVASLAAGQPKKIKHAIASGNVIIDVRRETKKGPSLSHIETDALEMGETETEAIFKITKPFIFTNKTKTENGDSLIEIRAPSGVFVLPPLDRQLEEANPFLSANVPGPVVVKFISDENGEDGVIRTLVNVRADHMTYDAKERAVHLTGNIIGDYVKKPIDSDKQGIEIESDEILIYLDADSLVTRVRSIRGGMRSLDGGGR